MLASMLLLLASTAWLTPSDITTTTVSAATLSSASLAVNDIPRLLRRDADSPAVTVGTPAPGGQPSTQPATNVTILTLDPTLAMVYDSAQQLPFPSPAKPIKSGYQPPADTQMTIQIDGPDFNGRLDTEVATPGTLHIGKENPLSIAGGTYCPKDSSQLAPKLLNAIHFHGEDPASQRYLRDASASAIITFPIDPKIPDKLCAFIKFPLTNVGVDALAAWHMSRHNLELILSAVAHLAYTVSALYKIDQNVKFATILSGRPYFDTMESTGDNIDVVPPVNPPVPQRIYFSLVPGATFNVQLLFRTILGRLDKYVAALLESATHLPEYRQMAIAKSIQAAISEEDPVKKCSMIVDLTTGYQAQGKSTAPVA